MSAGNFYTQRDARLFQGDIIRDAPHIHMKDPPLVALRPLNRERTRYDAYREAPPPGGFKQSGEQAAAFAQSALGMVISYGCAIENDPKHCMVALIRPLTPVPEQSKATIRENRNFAYFYLPALDNQLEESYVDFRRLTCVHPDFLYTDNRVASLSEDSVDQLMMRLFLFFTRRQLKPDMFPLIPRESFAD